MSSPINNQLQAIAKEMEAIFANGEINEGAAFQAEYDIQNLLKNKDLPPAVREKLQAALTDLKNGINSKGISLGDLVQAKFDISEAQKDLPPQ